MAKVGVLVAIFATGCLQRETRSHEALPVHPEALGVLVLIQHGDTVEVINQPLDGSFHLPAVALAEDEPFAADVLLYPCSLVEVSVELLDGPSSRRLPDPLAAFALTSTGGWDRQTTPLLERLQIVDPNRAMTFADECLQQRCQRRGAAPSGFGVDFSPLPRTDILWFEPIDERRFLVAFEDANLTFPVTSTVVVDLQAGAIEDAPLPGRFSQTITDPRDGTIWMVGPSDIAHYDPRQQALLEDVPPRNRQSNRPWLDARFVPGEPTELFVSNPSGVLQHYVSGVWTDIQVPMHNAIEMSDFGGVAYDPVRDDVTVLEASVFRFDSVISGNPVTSLARGDLLGAPIPPDWNEEEAAFTVRYTRSGLLVGGGLGTIFRRSPGPRGIWEPAFRAFEGPATALLEVDQGLVVGQLGTASLIFDDGLACPGPVLAGAVTRMRRMGEGVLVEHQSVLERGKLLSFIQFE